MRPHRIAGLVQNIRETTPDPHIVVIATGECADASRDLNVTLLEDDGGTWPQRINAGYRVTTEPYIFTAADDLLFHAQWFPPILREQEAMGGGVTATNDLYNLNGVHFVIARSYIETFGASADGPGTVMCDAYAHQFCDDECRAVAKKHGKWMVVQDSVVEHLHVGAGKSPMDDVYRLGESTGNQDSAVFHSRAHLWQ